MRPQQLLARAASGLPTQLLRTAYIALIRSHLEYCSAVWASAANTHLDKLDRVQKKASRIILHAPRDAHSEPLQKALKLESLETRRQKHITNIVSRCISNDCNPALNDMFELSDDGTLLYDTTSRIKVGKRRFENFAGDIYVKLVT